MRPASFFIVVVFACLLTSQAAHASSDKVDSVVKMLSAPNAKNLLNVDLTTNELSEEELSEVVYSLYVSNEETIAQNTVNYSNLEDSCGEILEEITVSVSECQQKIADTDLKIDAMTFQQDYTIDIFTELYSEFIEKEELLIEALELILGDNEERFTEFDSTIESYLGLLYDVRGFIVSYDLTFDELDEDSETDDTSEDYLMLQVDQKQQTEESKNRENLIQKLKDFSFLQVQKDSKLASMTNSNSNSNANAVKQSSRQNKVMGSLEKVNKSLIQNIDASTADGGKNDELLSILNTLIEGVEIQMEEMRSEVEEVVTALDDTIVYHEELVEDVQTKMDDLDAEALVIETTLDSENDLLESYNEELISYQEELTTEQAFCNEQLSYYTEQNEGTTVMRNLLVKSLEILGYNEADLQTVD